ncbi:hypothetical protein [Actinopolymorpha alba]|uniref:hypothetical protein n=1 Tax=Actinopolymorpha alba TaxID=533267 RepID=UPI00037D4345|nr:hypothetical protein [Actinopolymorpha alba]
MSDQSRRDPQGTNRWTKEGATPGEDPREIDTEQINPEYVRRLQERRQVTHAEEETPGEMGTTATVYDPTERD